MGRGRSLGCRRIKRHIEPIAAAESLLLGWRRVCVKATWMMTAADIPLSVASFILSLPFYRLQLR
jgi:hypothetical protein